MKASAGSLVVARPRTTRLRSRATDLCGSRVHFRYEPAARTSFMKALAATKDGSFCSQVSRFCHNVSNGTGTLPQTTLTAALNYATCLGSLGHLKELKTVMRRTLPVAKRILGENNETTLRMRWACAQALYEDPAATLDDLHEAVETAEETERIARRVFGSAHPLAVQIESLLRTARAALRAREETPSGGA